MSALTFSNRQRTRPLNLRLLREIAESVLAELPRVHQSDLTFYFVGAKHIAEINGTHLGHEGATDVITFDYNDPAVPGCIKGEVFICVEVAVSQAREFGTTWQSEVVRYLVHAVLHLCGYDDLQPNARRAMKQVENRLVQKMARRFAFNDLGRRASA